MFKRSPPLCLCTTSLRCCGLSGLGSIAGSSASPQRGCKPPLLAAGPGGRGQKSSKSKNFVSPSRALESFPRFWQIEISTPRFAGGFSLVGASGLRPVASSSGPMKFGPWCLVDASTGVLGGSWVLVALVGSWWILSDAADSSVGVWGLPQENVGRCRPEAQRPGESI